MMYKDEYHPQVKKDLKKLSPNLREAVRFLNIEYRTRNVVVSEDSDHEVKTKPRISIYD
jgi:mRNA-degrading endonuclease RelE of RelBE toxin-antitoxin system